MNSINLMNHYKKFKKDIEERFSIPLHYVIFGILLIMWFLNIPIDQLISFLDDDFKFKILYAFSIVYNHILLCTLIISFLIFIIIMILNVVLLFLHIIRSIFVLKMPVDDLLLRINQHELEEYYNILNEKNGYVIVKPEYRKMTNYYLLKIDDRCNDSQFYKVINKSKSLDEIIYNFDYLTNNL